MLELLTLTVLAQATACSPRDALDNFRHTEPGVLTVMRKGACSGLQFSTQWTEVAKSEGLPGPHEPGALRTKEIQWNTLTMSSESFLLGVAGISPVAEPETCTLPKDGRLVFHWNTATGRLSAQIAFDFQAKEVRAQSPLPTWKERTVGMIIRRSSPPIAHATASGGVAFTGSFDPDLPPTRYEAFPGSQAPTFEAAFEKDPQSFLGGLLLVATGEQVNQVPTYRCQFDAWRESSCQRTLIAARSADERTWYLWFEGDSPTANQ